MFHPRQNNSPPPSGAYTVAVEVQLGVTLKGRLYPAAPDSPAILFFHGNGEIAANYAREDLPLNELLRPAALRSEFPTLN